MDDVELLVVSCVVPYDIRSPFCGSHQQIPLPLTPSLIGSSTSLDGMVLLSVAHQSSRQFTNYVDLPELPTAGRFPAPNLSVLVDMAARFQPMGVDQYLLSPQALMRQMQWAPSVFRS